jgi:hypothetical protein
MTRDSQRVSSQRVSGTFFDKLCLIMTGFDRGQLPPVSRLIVIFMEKLYPLKWKSGLREASALPIYDILLQLPHDKYLHHNLRQL